MKRECCVCHRRLEGHHETIFLTPSEKQVVEEAGVRPAPNSFLYCIPCWKILADAQRGAQLMRGLGEMTLRQGGVGEDAELRATRFHQALLAKVPRNE